MKKNYHFKLFFSLLIVIFILLNSYMGIQACPHYDEYGDEYWWLFNMDGSSTMIYMRDTHERRLIIDSDFNVEHELFAVNLFFQESAIDKVRELGKIKMWNHEFWIDVDADTILEGVSIDSSSELYSVYYNLIITFIDEKYDSGNYQIIKDILSDQKTEVLKNKIFEISPQYEYEYANVAKIDKVNLKDFAKPIQMSFDLSSKKFNDVDEKRLAVAYLKEKQNLKYESNLIFGEIDKTENVFSFSANDPGKYALVLISEELLESIEQRDETYTENKSKADEKYNENPYGAYNQSEDEKVLKPKGEEQKDDANEIKEQKDDSILIIEEKKLEVKSKEGNVNGKIDNKKSDDGISYGAIKFKNILGKSANGNKSSYKSFHNQENIVLKLDKEGSNLRLAKGIFLTILLGGLFASVVFTQKKKSES